MNENEDNYSSFKGMKPYQQRKDEFINSIKSFNDIDDDKIGYTFDYGLDGVPYGLRPIGVKLENLSQ